MTYYLHYTPFFLLQSFYLGEKEPSDHESVLTKHFTLIECIPHRYISLRKVKVAKPRDYQL